MSNKRPKTIENRIKINTTLSPEAFSILEAESLREEKSFGEILDRLILEWYTLDSNDDVILEGNASELEEAKKRLDIRLDKVDLV